MRAQRRGIVNSLEGLGKVCKLMGMASGSAEGNMVFQIAVPSCAKVQM
jgi:hypothetical protein